MLTFGHIARTKLAPLGAASGLLVLAAPAAAATAPTAITGPVTAIGGTTATLSGLVPSTTYYFALVVSTADGTVTGPTASLTTPAIPPAALPPSVLCKVPNLKGDSLTKAKRALNNAHCSLGTVRRPKHSHGTLVVRSQGVPAGSTHFAGFSVAVRLGTQPPKNHHK